MEQRQLCADLISVHLAASDGSEREIVGILEEISTSRACLNLEEPVERGTHLFFRCTRCSLSCELRGTTIGCREAGELGYFIEVSLPPGQLRPLDSCGPGPRLSLPEQPEKCASLRACPKKVMAKAMAPAMDLGERVRMSGREVARLCGELDIADAAACFTGLFKMHPCCELFGEFLEAYRRERRRQPRASRKQFREEVESLVRLVGTIPAPLLSEKMECDCTVMGGVSMLEEVNALPGPQHELTLVQRDRELHAG
jgi:hypothetical protein